MILFSLELSLKATTLCCINSPSFHNERKWSIDWIDDVRMWQPGRNDNATCFPRRHISSIRCYRTTKHGPCSFGFKSFTITVTIACDRSATTRWTFPLWFSPLSSRKNTARSEEARKLIPPRRRKSPLVGYIKAIIETSLMQFSYLSLRRLIHRRALTNNRSDM